MEAAAEQVSQLSLRCESSSGLAGADSCASLSQESDEGHVEYKLKLCGIDRERLERLVTQLQYRMNEGEGEALYEIGVADDGTLIGLTDAELEESMRNLRVMAEQVGAIATVLRRVRGENGACVEVLVRAKPMQGAVSPVDVRICVAGNVDSGKSTLIGLLTGHGDGEGRAVKDNGRGRGRLGVFRHRHEIENGRTSSISYQIMGFDADGGVVNHQHTRQLGWTELVQQSSKVINFYDLAGHERYLKTTMYGLTASMPDYCLLLVGANMGIQRMTKEHLGIALALHIPIIVIITKIDLCPKHVFEENLAMLRRILKSPSVRRIPFAVKSHDDVLTAVKGMASDRFAPILCVSNVTGENIDLVISMLNLLHPHRNWKGARSNPFRVFVEDVFLVPGVGLVVAGTVAAGEVEANSPCLLGPDDNGAFHAVTVKSIHVKRVAMHSAHAGQNASFAIVQPRKSVLRRAQIRKGMVLVAAGQEPVVCRRFEADVLILHHPTTLRPGYQPIIHCGGVRQSARIVQMDKELLRTGDKARCEFEFMYRPEALTDGARLVFREGRTKGTGRISRVMPLDSSPAAAGNP